MTKRMLIMAGGVLVLVAALAFGFFLHIRQIIANSPVPKPETVTATPVAALEWQPQLSSVGTLTAVHGVDISSEVAGQVRKVNFKSGQNVQAGQVLVELNADPEIAQLNALKAAAELAATNLKRDEAQFAAEAISQAQLENDIADLKSKNAQLAQQQALVDRKTIRSPFAGRVGITATNPGQYLNPGDKIVTLQAIDPILVDFYLPQRQVGRVSVGQAVAAHCDAYEDKTFRGKITAINPKLDTTTRNVQVQATIANPQQLLLPGMYASAMVDVGEKKTYLTLPQTAITYNPYGSTVFIVKPAVPAEKTPAPPQAEASLEVEQTFVTTGDTRGDQVAITGGLKEGQMVVTSGQIKLKNGSRIVIDNKVQPANNPNPTPQEH